MATARPSERRIAFSITLSVTRDGRGGRVQLLEFAIVRLLWRSYRLTGQAVGLAWWVLGMGRFFFEEGLETR